MSDIVGGIFGGILALGSIGFIFWLIFYSLNKYGGVTFTSRHNVHRQREMNKVFHRQNLNEISKYDTETIKKAQENLERKYYAKTSDNLLLEVQKIGKPVNNKSTSELINKDNFLTIHKTQDILNSRKTIKLEHLNQKLIIKVIGLSKESPYTDHNGIQLTDAFRDNIPVFKRTLFCNLNSQIAMKSEAAIATLRLAYQYEKMEEYENAHKNYLEYLTKVQLKVSILSSNKYYDKIKVGSEIIGEVDHFKADRVEFLTLKSSTIMLKETH